MASPHRPPKHDVDLRSPSRVPPWALGPEWASSGLRQTGWVLLPLRAFLGVTFTFAGLQKLADPSFFDASSPTSLQHQMEMVAPSSPIGSLVRLSLHAALLVGVLIALAEVGVGVATLVGLKVRLAAIGGALLALTFFLTMSWTTSPYYYGADIVFLFAWTPLVIIGSADVLSLDGWLHSRVRATGFDGRTAAVAVEDDEAARVTQRRTIVLTGGATLLTAALTTLLGRMASATPAGRSLQTTPAPHRPQTRRPKHHTRTSHTVPQQPSGTSIGFAKAVPVGQAAQFTDPASGTPAWVVRLSPNRCVAFSAICTHAGCTVGYQASNKEFVCPCHGGTYSASTGKVLAGPPPAPLRKITAHIAGGHIYVD